MNFKKIKIIVVVFLIALISVIVGFASSKFPTIQSLEMKTIDERVKISESKSKKNKEIVLIFVDDASLKSMMPLVGRWPWPRSLWGDLIEFLDSSGAKAVLFDILFTELTSPRDSEGNIGEEDLRLSEATLNSPITYHAFQMLIDIEDEVNKTLINRNLPQDFIDRFAFKNLKSTEYIDNKIKTNNFYIPLTELYQSSFSAGVVEVTSDNDGIFRHNYPFRKYKDDYFSVLPISFVIEEKEIKNIEIRKNSFLLDKHEIPLQSDGKYLINLTRNFDNFSIGGVFSTIKKIELGDVEDLIVNPEDFKDKIVFVAASAAAVEDLKPTSLGNLPGVYLHASFLNDVLQNKFIYNVNNNLLWIVILIISLAATILALTLSNLFLRYFLLPVVIISWFFYSFYSFNHDLKLIPIVFPLISFGFTYILSFAYISFTEGKEKKFLKNVFGTYISPELIDQMHEEGKMPELGGEETNLTAFFTDIQGFSTFSEKLSAKKLVELLNEYLGVMTGILLEEGGTLDKYEGDAIIAFFGAPLYFEDHASRALRVAHKMQSALLKLRGKWKNEEGKWPEIVHEMRMRIGINTGKMVTGNMGCDIRMNYTMMGDSVNLAARLEESAKQYGIFTQISQFTKNSVDEKEFLLRELDTVRVVGKSEPVTTFELVDLANTDNKCHKALVELFSEGLMLYKQRNWKSAIVKFTESLKMEHERFPDLKDRVNPSLIYLDRCKGFLETPPPENWDGVFTLTQK